MEIRIFTDGGGFRQPDGTYNSASAVRVFKNDVLVNNYTSVHIGKTNNYGEIFAIAKGLELAQEHLEDIDDDFNVFVFTDSELYVKSLNLWIEGWIKKSKNGVLYTSTKTEVCNQDMILKAHNIRNDLINVEIYHINSHLTQKEIATNFEKFKTYNKTNISFVDYLFAVVQNHRCDEMVSKAYDEFLTEKGRDI